MFKEILDKGYYCFHDGFTNWRDAVKAACAPLIKSGAIEERYQDEIINKVEEFGPYIVIAPDICIPHAQEGIGVNETTVSFMKTENPVSFSPNPEHNARLFFVLASTDNTKHLENLMELSEYLSDETNVKKLLNVKNATDLKALF